jgi:hypothetical protein
MSQFAFLSADFAEVFAHASKAESLALSDPRSSCFYARLALEVSVNWLYARDDALRDPFETTLAARIHEPTFRKLVGDAIVAKARIIKDLGNAAVHETRAVSPERAVARGPGTVSHFLLADPDLRTRREAGCRSGLLPPRSAPHDVHRRVHAEPTSGSCPEV